jgi:hypothetical protein
MRQEEPVALLQTEQRGVRASAPWHDPLRWPSCPSIRPPSPGDTRHFGWATSAPQRSTLTGPSVEIQAPVGELARVSSRRRAATRPAPVPAPSVRPANHGAWGSGSTRIRKTGDLATHLQGAGRLLEARSGEHGWSPPVAPAQRPEHSIEEFDQSRNLIAGTGRRDHGRASERGAIAEGLRGVRRG